MKRTKILYWVFTAIFCLMIGSGAGMYIFNHEEVSTNFAALGFPTWLIYPMAIAKISGIVAILQRRNQTIKEWAYAGFFFNLSLATGAHIAAQDGEAFGAIMALAFMFASYFFSKRLEA